MTTTTSDRDKASLSGNLPAGFDPATELARLKGSDDAEQSNAPQHQSEEAVAAAGNVEERARYLSFAEGPTLGAHTDAIARHGKFGDFSSNNGGGPNDTLNGVTRKELREDEEEQEIEELGAQLAEQREQEHERWLAEKHTYAGATLTGEEWEAMSDWFKDDKNVASWEKAMMAQTGMSLTEVRQTGGKMKRFYELMDKDAAGTLTAQEKSEFTTLNNDKDVQKGVSVQESMMGFDRKPASTAEATSTTTELQAEATTSQSSLIAARADLNAQPLKPTFNPVAKGDEPKADIATAPTQSPASVKVAAMTADLDMG